MPRHQGTLTANSMPDASSEQPKSSGQGFKPGVSGNPAGRPRGVPDRRTTAKLARLEALMEGDPTLNLKPSHERWIALLTDEDAAIRLGAEKFLWEQMYGKAKETHVHELKDPKEALREASALAGAFMLGANGSNGNGADVECAN